MDRLSPSPPWPRWWPLALPLAYAAHLAEESFGGFVEWGQRSLGDAFTWDRFIAINAVAWVIVTALAVVATRPGRAWFALPPAVVFVLNGFLHLMACGMTWGYSPGVWTGLAIYVPVGTFTLARGRGHVGVPAYLAALLIGIAAHGIVFAIAFSPLG